MSNVFMNVEKYNTLLTYNLIINNAVLLFYNYVM